MTKYSLAIFVLLLTVIFSFGQNDSTNVFKQKNGTLKKDTTIWLTLEGMSVSTFLQNVSNKEHTKAALNVILMTNDFLKNWVKSSDIDTLIKLVKSKDKCSCFVSPLSSTIPFKDSADLGGYAIAFITAYKENKKVNFGLYACPKTNEKIADELIKWWTQQNRNGSRQH